MLGDVVAQRLGEIGQSGRGHDHACHEVGGHLVAFLVGMIDVEEVDAGFGVGRAHDRGVGVHAAAPLGARLDAEMQLLLVISHEIGPF